MASRRYFRVSLRALWVLLTLFCLWIGKESIEVRRENQAVAWVQQHGGQVEYDREPVPLWLQPLVGENFLRNVTKVMIRQRRVSDLSPLAAFGELGDLKLIACDVKDLQPISGLTNLTYLQLTKNQIEDVSPLASLQKLEHLNIHWNQVKDVSVVQGLTKLNNLVISDNLITVLPSLSRLTLLEGIALHNLKISDLSPLREVKSLKVINGISKEEKDKLRSSLPLLFPDIVRP